jgi:hypothetical protein
MAENNRKVPLCLVPFVYIFKVLIVLFLVPGTDLGVLRAARPAGLGNGATTTPHYTHAAAGKEENREWIYSEGRAGTGHTPRSTSRAVLATKVLRIWYDSLADLSHLQHFTGYTYVRTYFY